MWPGRTQSGHALSTALTLPTPYAAEFGHGADPEVEPQMYETQRLKDVEVGADAAPHPLSEEQRIDNDEEPPKGGVVGDD